MDSSPLIVNAVLISSSTRVVEHPEMIKKSKNAKYFLDDAILTNHISDFI